MIAINYWINVDIWQHAPNKWQELRRKVEWALPDKITKIHDLLCETRENNPWIDLLLVYCMYSALIQGYWIKDNFSIRQIKAIVARLVREGHVPSPVNQWINEQFHDMNVDDCQGSTDEYY